MGASVLPMQFSHCSIVFDLTSIAAARSLELRR
jgi:hypothetical protein